MSEPLAARLRRLEQQVRAFRDLHVSEVSEVARKLGAIAKLQSDELQLILDELADVVAQADAGAAAASADVPPRAASGDPAAASPKRAKWLAEQEERSHLTRRELLRGRDDERPGGSEPPA